jgi:hypothetical protein
MQSEGGSLRGPSDALRQPRGKMNTVPIPFFVGCQRSGTTLLRAMFDSHPTMAVAHHSYFISTLGRIRRKYERRHGFATEAFLADLFAHAWFQRWNLPQDAVRSVIRMPPPRDYAEAVRRVLALYARHQGRDRYGDKTPRYVLDMRMIADLLPEAKFVHLIRDGRDVALSLVNVDFGPRDIASAALYWKARVTEGGQAGRRLGRQRYREIRYEDLIKNPEAEVSALCTFLDLTFDRRMLLYHQRFPEIVATTAWPESHQHLSLPPTKGLRDWRREMDHGDLDAFNIVAGDLLEELGYDSAIPRPSARSHAIALARISRYRAKRVAVRSRMALVLTALILTRYSRPTPVPSSLFER